MNGCIKREFGSSLSNNMVTIGQRNQPNQSECALQFRKTRHLCSTFLFISIPWVYFTFSSILGIFFKRLSLTWAALRKGMLHPLQVLFASGTVMGAASLTLDHTWRTRWKPRPFANRQDSSLLPGLRHWHPPLAGTEQTHQIIHSQVLMINSKFNVLWLKHEPTIYFKRAKQRGWDITMEPQRLRQLVKSVDQ